MREPPSLHDDQRVVKPRNEESVHSYRVIALSNGVGVDENGELHSEVEIIANLDVPVPTVFATRNAGDFVARCDSYWHSDKRWNWQARADEREIVTPGNIRLASRVSVCVSWFGFKGTNQHVTGVRHVALDPIVFYGRKLDEIIPGTDDILLKLQKWAVELRNFADENKLDIRSTNGSMACQFLRDRRFYPRPRRKVPAAINKRSRTELPGNYYRIFVPDTETERTAIYLDQSRSHHYHASYLQFPDSDSLTARGDFLNLGDNRHFHCDADFHGLYYVRYRTPIVATKFRISEHEKANTAYDGFIFSNEIPLYTSAGYSIECTYAAWGSYKTESGLNRYAQWAQGELDKYGDPKWLKPLLLATYGVLATRPRSVRYVYGKAKRGEPAQLHTGAESLYGLAIGSTTGKKVEPSFANVLHRGMIEAACRMESLEFARLLHVTGYKVLSIYADAVIIERDIDTVLPELPKPWRVQSELNHLKFVNTQAFVSGEMTKLPGIVGRDILKYGRGTNSRPEKPMYESITGRRISAKRAREYREQRRRERSAASK